MHHERRRIWVSGKRALCPRSRVKEQVSGLQIRKEVRGETRHLPPGVGLGGGSRSEAVGGDQVGTCGGQVTRPGWQKGTGEP